MSKCLSAALLLVAAGAVHATWHPISEGDGGWTDFDEPLAGQPYHLAPAGIYEPAPYFLGSIGTQADPSDTLLLYVGSGLRLTDIRVAFGVHAAAASPVLLDKKATLSFDTASGTPLVALALTAPGSFSVSGLELPPDLYRLRIQSDSLSLQDGSPVAYSLSFTLAAVPEPAAWVSMLLGLGVLSRRAHRPPRATTRQPAQPRRALLDGARFQIAPRS